MKQEPFEKWLEKVLHRVHYRPDRQAIARELRGHFEDGVEFYREEGLEEEQCREKALLDLGEPEGIGKLLNREHSPLLGYGLVVVNVLAALLLVPALLALGSACYEGISQYQRWMPGYKLEDVPLAWEQDLGEGVWVDSTYLRYTKALCTEEGDLYVFYMKCTLPGFIEQAPVAQVADEKGEIYPAQRVSGQNSPVAFGYIQVPEYPAEEETFRLLYIQGDRSYRLEVGE